MRIIVDMPEQIGWRDGLIAIVDQGLRTVVGTPSARRPSPASAAPDNPLSATERDASSALMRVNRAGEISAQALYLGQALFARAAATREHLLAAADEERDHLAWCSERLDQLGGRASLLDPLWFVGSSVVGMLAGIAGDRLSLGFVSETERQVEAHLDDHLARLPDRDLKSRAILRRMADDEARHGRLARSAGGQQPPAPISRLMALGGGFLRRAALIV